MFLLFLLITGIITESSSQDDEDLWHTFLSGDKDAMSVLFLRYYGDLYRYGMKINSNDEAVRDGIQELFFRLWKKKEALDQAISVKKYLVVSLRRILLRQLEQHYAREKRDKEYSDLIHQSISGIDEAIIHNERTEEQRYTLHESLSELTKRQREVLFLKFYEGYSNKEIAQITNLRYQRVCNIIHESILKLRQTVL